MRSLRHLAGAFWAALYPCRCFACGEPLGIVHRSGACATCWAELRPLPAPLCRGCAWPIPTHAELAGAARGYCAACSGGRPALDAVVALVPYAGRAPRFLLRAKIGRRREILEALGAQLAERVVRESLAGDGPLIVPVPSHPFARLQRGFSPGEEIARRVAARTGLPWRPLIRRAWRSGRFIKRLGLAARRGAARTAFIVHPETCLRGTAVLLVDDVLTTGASLASCATALRAAGAGEIRAAVWARTPGPSRGLLL